jgi:hypothetical protein
MVVVNSPYILGNQQVGIYQQPMQSYMGNLNLQMGSQDLIVAGAPHAPLNFPGAAFYSTT